MRTTKRTKKPKRSYLDPERIYTVEELRYLLTEKQKNFCHEYVIDWNGTRAIHSCYNVKNKQNASVIAANYLKNPLIKQYIEFIRRDYEKICGVSKMRQIKEFTKIAYSSIAHMHEDWILLKDFNTLTDNQKEAIESIETKTEQRVMGNELVEIKYVKLKLYSKIEALDRINKLMGYNEPDQIKVESNVNTTFDLKTLTKEQKQTLLEIARKNEYSTE